MAESPDVCCEQCSGRAFVACNVKLADTYPRLLLYFATLYASLFLCHLTYFSYYMKESQGFFSSTFDIVSQKFTVVIILA